MRAETNCSSCAVVINRGVQNEKQRLPSGIAGDNKHTRARKLKQGLFACLANCVKPLPAAPRAEVLEEGILQLHPEPARLHLCGRDGAAGEPKRQERRGGRPSAAPPRTSFPPCRAPSLPTPTSSQPCSHEQPCPRPHSPPAGQGHKNSENLGRY